MCIRLSLLRGCFHVVEIGRVSSRNDIRSVSTIPTAGSSVCTFYLKTKMLPYLLSVLLRFGLCARLIMSMFRLVVFFISD